MNKKYILGIIGAGNMASAIVGGILKNKIIQPSDIIISDTDEAKLTNYASKGLNVTNDNINLAKSCNYVLFAVKPQCAPEIFAEIRNYLSSDCAVISIMAGISIAKLRSALGERNFARIMPNTPALIGEGMSALAFSENYKSEFVTEIFSSLGKVEETDESLFDAVTSLSGSGPAYVYLFIKSLIDGGIEGGLNQAQAKTLAIQTVLGAAKMIDDSDKPIDDLINAVCSKGGTTIQAIDSFRNDGFEDIVKRGIEKCRNRSKELGK